VAESSLFGGISGQQNTSRGKKGKLVILTAVDDNFLPEAASLIKSCARHAPGQRFYLFLVNSDEQRIAKLHTHHPNLIVEHVQWPYDAQRWRGLMCSARSIPIIHVLETYKEPTLYLDSDILVMASLDELFAELQTCDLLIKYRPEIELLGPAGTLNSAKFNSGVIAIRPTEVTLQFIREYDHLLREWIDAGKPIYQWREEHKVNTYIDQEFLYMVYDKLKEQLKFKALPDKFNDARFKPGSIIWHGKGVARKRLPYVLAKLSYDNCLFYYIFRLIRYPFCFAYYHLQQWALARKRSKNSP